MPYLLVLVAFFSLLYHGVCHDQTQLKFCVEDSEYPPFNYQQRNANSQPELVGYDIDLLKRVFLAEKIAYEVVALPWRRCLKEVEQGFIDGAMSASLNERRQHLFIPSVPYYFLHPSYYYLKQAYPNGLPLEDVSRLLEFGPVCGISGFNYDNFGINHVEKIYRIKDLYLLPKMLAQKRCRFFLARSEVFSATIAINGLHDLKQSLARQLIPNVPPEPFHLLVSPLSPNKDLILSLFNSKVTSLQSAGQLDRLLEYHLYIIQQFEP
ncbi:substrate-binding periplasmic protein [Motilimonas cestriensis]|uniref:substrate-binding periplasmic protein n=1 Tax=Motilimonas cestriensis TaxID=2742685 RepID=UPI003DA48E15